MALYFPVCLLRFKGKASYKVRVKIHGTVTVTEQKPQPCKALLLPFLGPHAIIIAASTHLRFLSEKKEPLSHKKYFSLS